ncbi:MAG: oxidoreductase [Rhodocyclales bacterium RIFCSPLOWO2_02_FULL_63_24]|nr:MAG: oxidoreductase [Rhodocyclales bacterium GWA2_65_19]OHC67586.1 MAG: oxidoreductase [Rhodocyclales bacterium RIFCSPLOWO2_02_FULL_63_24]
MTQSKHIVLTGVTRGLGRAMLDEFVAGGHVVAGCGRSAAAIETLRAQFPAPHHFATVDVANDKQVGRWARQVLKAMGPPSLLINNAAVMNSPAPLWEVPAAEFGALIDVNIKGTAHVLRHFVPAMIAQGRGVIVNFSSGWGRGTAPNVAPYCASKWAIEGLTRALAEELPKGMAAIPLNPGIIDTEMLRAAFGASAGNYESAAQWAQRAVPFLLKLGPRHNGKALTID